VYRVERSAAERGRRCGNSDRNAGMDDMLKRLPRRLRQLLDPAVSYVTAVSGGADSMALAEGMHRAGLRFTVCHVEHGIRGEASREDARFVEAYCRERKIPFRCISVDATAAAREAGLSLEDAARRLRYAALERCADETGAAFIVTAHQKEDQAETLLLRLLRGSGTLGLAGMRFRHGRILRPLLEFRGRELRDFCRAAGLEWREDETNQDCRYVRNRIRRELLPYLAARFPGDMTEILSRTARAIQEDADFLEDLARQALPTVEGQAERVPGGIPAAGPVPYLDGKAWLTLPPPVAVRVLRLFCRKQGVTQELTAANLENLESVLHRGHSGKKIPLPGCWQCLYIYGKLFLFPQDDNQEGKKVVRTVPAAAWKRELPWPDRESGPVTVVELPGGGKLIFSVQEGPSEGLPFRYRQEAVYPLETARNLAPSLTIRFRHAGDRFFPLKGLGHKSLKRYLIDSKMPAAERACLPVVAAGTEVLWLPGYANAAWPPVSTSGRSCRWLVGRFVPADPEQAAWLSKQEKFRPGRE
jgi:tRNA(Ile)-lysidine synthase